MRILLVEDNADHRELMRLALTGHDSTWEVEGVVSGEEALRRLAEGEVFDLVFLDYSLPQRDGLWFLGEIRRGKASPPVVMVTGRGDEQVAVEAMKCGAYDYVVKGEGYLQRLPVVAQRAMEAHQLAVERKLAEEALKKSEERFRTSAETLLEGFAILSAVRDSNGQIIDFKYEYINKGGCKMNQKPHEEHMGKTLLELLPTHKEIGLFDEYVRVVETGQSLTKEFLIYEAVYGSGERLRQAFDVRITRLGDGFVTTWQDITDKKKGEELLRQSEERLRLLIENSKDVVIMADLEGSFIYYNGPPEYGITAEEALGKNPFSIFEPVIAASLMNQLKLVIKGGEALTFENNIPWRGESFWFLNQMYPIRDEKGRMIAVGLIARDITERKRLEEEVWRHNEELGALNAIALMVNSSLDLRQILDQTLDKVLEITKMEVGSLYLTDPQTEELVLSTYRGVSKEFADQVRTFKLGESIVGLAAQSGKPIVADELTEDPRVTTTLVSGEGIRSLAAIPMKSKNKVQGMINIASYTCHPFTNKEVDFYTAIANQIGVAIENVRLYEAVQRELTERKQAEEMLRESEGKYRNLVESISDVVYTIDSSGVLTYISPVVKNTLGYEPDELIGRQFLEFVHKEDHDLLMRRFSELREGIVGHSDYRVIGKQGDIKWVRTLTNPIIEEGGFVGARGVLIDINDRKRAEEALRTERQRLHDVLEAIPIMVCLLMPDYHVAFANRAFRDKFGESHGRRCYEYCFGKKEPCDFCEAYSVLKTAKPHHWQVTTPDGASIIDAYDFPFTDADGSPMILEMDIDITERKKAEEVLQESEEKYRALVENSPSFIAIYQEGTLKYVNKAMCERLGWTFEEMTSVSFNPIEKIIPQRLQSQLRENIAKRLSGESIPPYEFIIKARDGSEIPVIISAQAILYGGKLADEVIHTDITERKQAEEEKRRLEERSRKVVEDIFRFIPEGVLVFSRKMELLRQNQAFRELVSGYAKRLGFAEDELENLIIDKIKAGMGDKKIKEIRISRKHETWK
jgi:PAS domain S-box-containing protein